VDKENLPSEQHLRESLSWREKEQRLFSDLEKKANTVVSFKKELDTVTL
jgi:hypothetical protein